MCVASYGLLPLPRQVAIADTGSGQNPIIMLCERKKYLSKPLQISSSNKIATTCTCAYSASQGYPKTIRCATSRLCQYSSGTKEVWLNTALLTRNATSAASKRHLVHAPIQLLERTVLRVCSAGSTAVALPPELGAGSSEIFGCWEVL